MTLSNSRHFMVVLLHNQHFFLVIKRNIFIQMIHLSGNCQKEKINKHVLSYALKESCHMYGLSEHTLLVDARRISSHARVFIDLIVIKRRLCTTTVSPFCLPATECLCSQMRSECQFMKQEAISGVTGQCLCLIKV